MANIILSDIYWRYNPHTTEVDVIRDGILLESTTLGKAAERLNHYRNAQPNMPARTVTADDLAIQFGVTGIEGGSRK